MSIVSKAIQEVLAGQPLSQVWDDAKTSFENMITQIANKSQIAAQALSSSEAVVKQGISDAISIADSALGQHALPVAKAVEEALDAALSKATGGLSTPFNAIIDAGLDDLTGIAITAAHAWAAKAKAELAAVPASPQPQTPTA